MKALSIRQPWAWLIVNGWKNIENRDWPTKLRGRIWIHAAKTMTEDDYESCRIFCDGMIGCHVPLPSFKDPCLLRCGIVGAATLLDCVDHHENERFCGPFGFVLADPVVLNFVPMKGRLGFFDVDLTEVEHV